MAKFAVTTRSHLKGTRFFPSMVRASLRIRKQLRESPGCLRFATIVMSPRDFWTITVWRTRGEMLEFMRSGAHEDIMWEFSRWLDSFWLMRWRPTEHETGHWRGLSLAERPELPAAPPPRTPEQQKALDAAFDAVPRLRAAADPSGAASLAYAPHQRRARRQVAAAVGTTVRVEVSSRREGVAAWRRLFRIRRTLLRSDATLRVAFGVSNTREFYLLTLFRDHRAWEEFLASSPIQDLQRRWPQGVWTMRWDGDNEFGHWDGMRLRRAKLGTMVSVPKEAEHAATPRERG
ncbi:MAG TPA: hypothetical protein VM784_15380 [Actinomycetota bacterium]|nr:hypothetical protein [Actinomycetota bacterium]